MILNKISDLHFRITFLYGLLFEHGNLNLATHDILHELFGVATTKILSHTALITRKERVVSFEGKDIYLPGYKKRNRLADPRFRRKMDLLNFPIMFFNGMFDFFKFKDERREWMFQAWPNIIGN